MMIVTHLPDLVLLRAHEGAAPRALSTDEARSLARALEMAADAAEKERDRG